MKTTAKIISLLLILAMALSMLIGCNQSSSVADDDEDEKEEQKNPDGPNDPDDSYDPDDPDDQVVYEKTDVDANGVEYGIPKGADYAVVIGYLDENAEVIISDVFEGKPVTTIGDSAFEFCYSLTSITIPNSVTNIGECALSYCESLANITVDENNTAYKSVDGNLYSKDNVLVQYAVGKTEKIFAIPNGVTSICDAAFSWCDSLTSITIPNSVTSIGDYAFESCVSLTSITIPNSVTNIGDSAFWDCTSLTSITIPNSVTSIGDFAFYCCDSLTSITIPNSVTSIGERAFSGCGSLANITVDENNTAYKSVDGNLYSKDNVLVQYAIGKTEEIFAIPNGVTSIGDRAFYSCNSLTSITIPNSVTSIGDYAFCCCDSLTSITIPNSVTSIGECALSYCESLANITVDENNTAYKSVDGNLYSKDNVLVQYAIGKTEEIFAIPSGVTSIGDRAFYSCNSLTSITIPNSVTSIGDDAFYGCASLTSITIPNSVTSIGDSAFFWCDSLPTGYYNGIADEWNNIEIGDGNDDLTIYYYSESKPTNDGNFWRYVDGIPTAW